MNTTLPTARRCSKVVSETLLQWNTAAVRVVSIFLRARTIVLLLLMTVHTVGTAKPAISDATAPPMLMGDECFRLPHGRMPIFFGPASYELNVEGMQDRIAAVAAYWKEDGGAVLLTGHADPSEASLGRGTAVSADRLAEVLAALEGAGIPGTAIWIKDAGVSVPESSGPTRDEADMARNRRVEIAMPAAGSTCRHSRRRLRAEWVARNCFPTADPQIAGACSEVLEILSR